MNESLPPELHDIENLLSSLAPAELSEQTAESLAVAMDEVGQDLSDQDAAGLDELEKHLEELSPSTMRTDVLSRMVQAMDTWYEQVPEEEKVISFGADQPSVKPKPARRGGMVAAAAAVALLGGVSAIVIPNYFSQPAPAPVANMTAQPNTPEAVRVASDVQPRNAWLVPDAATHRIINTSERGLIMTPDNTAHRCIQFDSMETIKLEDESGREILIERPNVRYLLIPVEAN